MAVESSDHPNGRRGCPRLLFGKERRKIMKKLISIVLACVLMLALAVTASADDTTYSYGHFYYHDHDGYVSIAGYLGSETDIEIPSSIAGKPVSEIESGAFDNADSAQTITVPDTVVITYPDSFEGADSLGRIICESGDTPVTAPDGVNVQYPEVTTTTTTPAPETRETTETTTSVTTTTAYNAPVWSGQIYTDSDTTQQSVVTQDEDIGDFAYEEDGLPEEIETVVTESTSESTSVSGKKTEKTTSSGMVSTSATTAVTTIVTTPENVVSVSVNDAGQLVGIDERGTETVLEPEKTYATEQQSDGSVKIVDDNGEEVVIAEETTAAAQPAEPETQPELPSPSQESEQFNVVPIIIIIVAGAAVIALVAVIILIRKRK